MELTFSRERTQIYKSCVKLRFRSAADNFHSGITDASPRLSKLNEVLRRCARGFAIIARLVVCPVLSSRGKFLDNERGCRGNGDRRFQVFVVRSKRRVREKNERDGGRADSQIEKETEIERQIGPANGGGERRQRRRRGGGGDIKMKSHGLINTRLSRVIELSRDTEPRGAEFTKGTDHQHTLDPRRACTRARTRGPLSLSLPLPLRPSTDRARIPLAERAAAACIPLSVPFCPPSPSPIPPAGLPRPRA